MKEAVQSGDKKSAIAADGTIDYYFSDSMSGGPGYANFTVVLS